jgi:PhnO protein
MIDNSIKVRRAEMGDLQVIYRFICELEDEKLDYDLFQQIFKENLVSPNCLYSVAESKTKVIGFISLQTQKLLHHCGTVAEIQEYYVDKKFRSKGIGRLLMDEVKKSAEINNIKSIEVTSNKMRTENIKVYERLGFKLSHNKFTL